MASQKFRFPSANCRRVKADEGGLFRKPSVSVTSTVALETVAILDRPNMHLTNVFAAAKLGCADSCFWPASKTRAGDLVVIEISSDDPVIKGICLLLIRYQLHVWLYIEKLAPFSGANHMLPWFSLAWKPWIGVISPIHTHWYSSCWLAWYHWYPVYHRSLSTRCDPSLLVDDSGIFFYPIAGWFISLKWMMTGGTLILGNLQILIGDYVTIH